MGDAYVTGDGRRFNYMTDTEESYLSIPSDESGSFGTLEELIKFAKENNVPEDARIEYEGCGSHSIEFVWKPKEALDPIYWLNQEELNDNT